MTYRSPLDAEMERQGRRSDWLARHLGVHKSQVSRWRSGMHIPHHATQIRIARALDLTPADLGWDNDEDEQVAA